MKTLLRMCAGFTIAILGQASAEDVAIIVNKANPVDNLTIAQVVPYPWNEADGFTRNYRKLATAGSLAPSYLGMEGYIAGTVLIEALRRCAAELTRSRLNSVLKSFQLRFAGMNIDYSGDSLNGSRYIDLVSVKTDGTFLR